MKLTFLGATRNVTGSSTLVRTDGMTVLVDCGLYQERHLRERNWAPFPVLPREIDAVLLTHAHLDHCGLLPRLANEGYRGPVYATGATCELTRIILLDSAHIQEEDAAFKRRRHEREGRKGPYPDTSLYTQAQVESFLPQLTPVVLGDTLELGPLSVSWHEAGHVFGSTSIRIDGPAGRLVFSGDIGRWDRPIINDPTIFDRADWVVMESTYGDRNHEDAEPVGDMLAEAVNSTHSAGGNLVIPSFALERAQDVLYELAHLEAADRIPHVLVFLDSPMAVRITDVFENHPELFDRQMQALMARGESPFQFPGLKMVRSTGESKAINHIRGTAVIIAGSGMCTGGRIKHHLVANIERPESTLLFVGYQAVGTLGREITDGAEEVRILGARHCVRARVARINGFSGHADQGELMRWIGGLESAPRQVMLNHGEPKAMEVLAEAVRERWGCSVSIPEWRQSCELSR